MRWKARGTYDGGFPGASAEAVGRTISFTGTGTLRIADGKLAEYWLNAGSMLFSQQLGVREVPAQSRALHAAVGHYLPAVQRHRREGVGP